MIFFTADTHFGHHNIIKYCNRPFSTIEEMDETIIKNINSKVQPNDILYHLGDFAIKNIQYYRGRIKCKNIHLIIGNHDKRNMVSTSLFKEVHTLYHMKTQVKDEIKEFVLCHYAMRVWNKSHYGAIHLYGHSHGSLPDNENALSMDIGVDCHNFFPLSINEVMDIMSKKKWKPIDHHVPRDAEEEVVI